MIQIKFITGKNEDGSDAYTIVEESKTGKSILDVAEDNGIEIPNNCGGVCACSTCHIKLREGAEFISEMEDDEMDTLDEADDTDLDSRLSCQCMVEKEGTIIVEIPSFHGIAHTH